MMDKNELIQKWLNNELTYEEQNAFDTLDDAPFLKEIIEEGKRFSAEKHSKTTDFKTLEKRLADKKKTRWIQIIPRIAAVLLISFGLFYFINNPKNITYNTKYSENKTITLPDNSIVELNELSNLTYQAKNWKNNRTLQLKGEAFFDVEKGMRFDVNTAKGTVSVLGTEFNVLDRDSIFKVSCYEGLVQVSYQNKMIKLPAGKEFTLVNGIEQNTNTALAEPKWLKNMSVFDNIPLVDVIKELESQYNVTVELSIKNKQTNFTGAFTNNNIESALKAITQPLNLSYEIKNNTEIIISDEPN
ncbi:FecR family protein [Tenacibaculum crassostreae]|uniref:FecR family protein n=1 Tax=Tenacibaculum crassostreae TaxID=502683 RepID=UPI0038949903